MNIFSPLYNQENIIKNFALYLGNSLKEEISIPIIINLYSDE